MCEYFRTAAKCDPTVAVISPVPLYNLPDDRDRHDDGGASPASGLSSVVNGVTSTTTPAAVLTGYEDSFQLSRAVLDRPSQEAVRLTVKRDANVLAHLARREEKARLRAMEEAKLTEKVLEAIHCNNADHLELSDKEDVEGGSKKSPTAAGAAPTIDPQRSLLPTGGMPVIPVFEMIKIEEERCLRRELLLPTLDADSKTSHSVNRSSSITALYNALTIQRLREEYPEVPPSEFPKSFGDQLLPAKVDAKQAAAAVEHSAAVRAVEEEAARRREQLKAKLESIKEVEAAALQKQLQRRAERDEESSTIMHEVINQDYARRENMEAARLLRVAQYHQNALLGTFSTDVPPPLDPTLPVMPFAVQEALQFMKKPQHPIDAYQSSVREAMLKQQQERDL